jgi:hypothetical protein
MPKWFETQAGWDRLLRHRDACAISGCPCTAFVRNFEQWSKQLPLDTRNTAQAYDTWLWFTFNSCGQFRWQCVGCHRDTPLDNDDIPITCQLQNLLKHQSSTKHAQCIDDAFNESGQTVAYTVPSAEMFKDLLSAFQKGEAPTNGYQLPSGICGKEKSDAMLWCLSEARDDDKREAIELADVMIIKRDERKKRMHIRFNCAGSKAIDLSGKCGFLGQSRDHNPDAFGISQATVGIFRELCTSRNDAPKTLDAKPHFHKESFEKAKKILEATAVDSAENEVVSVTDSYAKGPNGEEPDFPNNKHILRDGAHSARRLLSRLYNADQVLHDTWIFFQSMASIIQWSDDLRQMYTDCVGEADDGAVDTKFAHLRAAKHRIETWLTPLSRSITQPSGHIISDNIN